MTEWKRTGIVVLELIIFGVLGFLVTVYAVAVGYRQLGVVFMGNVWVIWFAVSFILFCLYNIVLFLLPKNYPMKDRLYTKMFWILFLVAIGLVVIPVWNGETPY